MCIDTHVLDVVNVGHDEAGDYAVLAENVDGEGEQGDIEAEKPAEFFGCQPDGSATSSPWATTISSLS